MFEITKSFFMNHQAVKRITYTHTPCFGIVDYQPAFLPVAKFIKICMADARTGLYNRNSGIFTYKIDEISASSWYNQIDIMAGIKQLSCFTPACRKQCKNIRIYIVLFKY